MAYAFPNDKVIEKLFDMAFPTRRENNEKKTKRNFGRDRRTRDHRNCWNIVGCSRRLPETSRLNLTQTDITGLRQNFR